MVVRDDDVNSHLVRQLHLFQGAHTAVGGYNKVDPQGPELLQPLHAQPVALFRAMWNIRRSPRPKICQAIVQQCRRRHPIRIEVPVHGDQLTVLDCPGDPLDGRPDVRKESCVGKGALLSG